MHRARQRVEGVIVPGAIALTILAFAAGSSSVAEAVRIGHTARWVVLFALLGVGVSLLATSSQPLTLPRSGLLFTALVAAFAALSVLSTSWSVAPRLTFERAASFSVLVAAAAALTVGAPRTERLRGLLGGIVSGAGIVAGLGLLLLVVRYHDAVQPGGVNQAWRLRGFGMNPNTAPMLYAVALPPGAWLSFASKTRRRRVGAAACVLIMYVGIALSGSRGALGAATVGLGVVALTAVPTWRRKALALACVVAAGTGAAGTRIATPGAPPAPPASSSAAGGTTVPAPSHIPAAAQFGSACQTPRCARGARRLVREFPLFRGPVEVNPWDEIGAAVFHDRVTNAGSGRIAAWQGALSQIARRPVLGYGFGTEARVFVDRWNYFEGAVPENSYLGLLLQVGAVGLVLLVLAIAAAALPAVRLLRSGAVDAGVAAASLASVVAGIVLMVAQSYVYSVGNIATASVWLAAFVLSASTARGRSPVDA